MGITIHDSLHQARMVIETLRQIVSRLYSYDDFPDLEIETFDNHREQGLVIKEYSLESKRDVLKNFAVSQHRNSDEIVVYEYSRDMEDHPSNLPKEECSCWHSYELFEYGEWRECAEYIVDRIIELNEEEE